MSFRRTVTAIALCGACVLAGGEVRANGSVHHNTTNNVTNEGDVTNQGGQGGQGGNGQGGAGGQGGNSASNASSAQSMSYEGGDYEGGEVAMYLSGCQQGAGGYGGGFGGGIGAESKLCQRLRLAAAYQSLGMHYQAAETLRQAGAEINGGAADPDETPVDLTVSQWLGHRVRALFGWLPFIGHAA